MAETETRSEGSDPPETPSERAGGDRSRRETEEAPVADAGAGNGTRSHEQGVDGPPLPDDEGLRGIEGSGMFPELVRAHYEWERDAGDNGARAQRYRQALSAFERREGEVTHVYWATKRASAVALTVKPRGRIASFLYDGDATIRLHRATDWLAREYRIAELLHHCDTLAIKVSAVLQGTSERIAMQWIYAVQSHLLGYLERTDDAVKEKDLANVFRTQARELVQIERYYSQAGEKAARIVYFWGMMLGVLVSSALALGLAAVLWSRGWFDPPHTLSTQTFFACFIAGGLGAIVSVLTRMSSNSFRVDFEVGRSTVRRLGSFRPFIGAAFGIALYFLFHSELLRTTLPEDAETAFFFFGILAFLAGFNERWTNVLFGKAEKTIAVSLGDTVAQLEADDEGK